jgi:uncharacterized membrane protein YjgN (DUF898 family)
MVPYVILLVTIRSHQAAEQHLSSALFAVVFGLVIIIIALIWDLYFVKTILQNTQLNGTNLQCNYSFGEFLGVVALGIFLTIITIGIYAPWFVKNMQRFFIDNTSYKEKKFAFQGKGGKLFVILLLTLFIPMVIVIIFMAKVFGTHLNDQPILTQIINNVIIYIIMIPYIYYIYKWMVDTTYKGYHFKWHTKFWPSIGKIALEMFLSMITFGFYAPLAYVRLYKYFLDKTKSETEGTPKIQFNYDIDQKKDYLFILVQALLTVITLGIYFPWSFCKVSQRILEKTSMEKIE